MMRKITAFLLTAVMMLSVFSVQSFGWGYEFEEETENANQWINTDQMTILNLAGLTDWDDVRDMGTMGDEIMPRWLFAHYLCEMNNFALPKTAGFEAKFKDLTSEHKYYGAIKAVIEAGMMKGYPDGTFRANESITGREAAEAILMTLGYEKHLAIKGYNWALKQTKLFEGLPEDAQKLTHSQVLRMFYNGYMSPAVKEESYSGTRNEGITSVELIVDEDYLGLEHLAGIVYSKGVLTGTQGSTVWDSNKTIGPDEVMIDSELYKFDDSMLWEEPATILGYNIDFYYKKADSGQDIVVYMYPNDKNSEFTVSHEDIVSYSGGEYRYYDKNNKEKSVKLSNDVLVIYNSVATPAIRNGEMIPRFGTVTFLNNDGKTGYEIVKIDNYDFYYISSVNEETMTVYDTENGRSLVMADADSLYLKDDKGEIPFSRLKKGNVLAVKKNSSNASYERIWGEVVPVSQKGVKIVAVKPDSIQTGTAVLEKWEKMNVEKDEIYTLFAYKDCVVMAIPEKGNAEYAYLLNVAIDGVFEKTLKARLVDMQGNELVFDGAKTLYVDGVKKDYEQIPSILLETAKSSTGYLADYPMAQPVKYELNTNGQLSKIDTKVEEAAQYGNPEDASFTSSPYDSGEATYYTGNTALYSTGDLEKNVGIIGVDTKIIFIPNSRDDVELYWNKGFIDKSKYRADVCDRDEVGTAGAVFAYYDPDTEGVYAERKFFIVSDMREIYNAETTETEYFVDGYLQSSAVSYSAEQEVFEKLNIGDVIRVEIGRNDKIVAFEAAFEIKKDYSAPESRMKVLNGSTYPLASAYKFQLGTVLMNRNGVLKFTQSMPDDEVGWNPDYNTDSYITSKGSVWKYTEVRGVPTVEAATLDDIITYEMDPKNPSKVVINMIGSPSQFYIIEK